jgi:hypothetical protein
VSDTIAPEFSVIPSDLTVLCSEEIQFDSADGTDNCGNITIVEIRDTIPGISPSYYTITRDFIVYDACGNSNTARQTITVIGDNIAPVAMDDYVDAVSGEEMEIDVLANDTDPNSMIDASSLSILSGPSHGQAIVSNDFTIIYTPNVDFTGLDTIRYVICDDGINCEVLCDTAEVIIVVNEREMSVWAQDMCLDNAPYVEYIVTPLNFIPTSGLTIRWLNVDGDEIAVMYDQPLSGTALWPGAELDSTGKCVNWPGWLYVNEEWIEGADGFESLRPSVRLIFELNPTAEVFLEYPPSTPDCYTAPPVLHLEMDEAIICANETVIVDVLANDTVERGIIVPESLLISIPPINGSVFIDSNYSISYTANPGFLGCLLYTSPSPRDRG